MRLPDASATDAVTSAKAALEPLVGSLDPDTKSVEADACNARDVARTGRRRRAQRARPSRRDDVGDSGQGAPVVIPTPERTALPRPRQCCPGSSPPGVRRARPVHSALRRLDADAAPQALAHRRAGRRAARSRAGSHHAHEAARPRARVVRRCWSRSRPSSAGCAPSSCSHVSTLTGLSPAHLDALLAHELAPSAVTTIW